MSRVVHFEIMADEPEKVLSFYNNVLGWEAEKWGEEEYWLVNTGSAELGINGGVGRNRGGQKVINTVDVASIDDFCAKVTAAGGTIAVPKMPVPQVGWLAYATDPEGNMFGAMQHDPSVEA